MAKGFSSGPKVPNVQQHIQFQPGSHITNKLSTNPTQKYDATMAARHMYQQTNANRQAVSTRLTNPRTLP